MLPPPLLPPLRYSLVEEGLHRGAYPSLVNQRFLSRLQLRTVVSLLPEAPTPDLLKWCEQHGINNHAVVVPPFKKDEVTLTHEHVTELLQLLVSPERQPVYVHCLDGVSVTGTLIMCLRKLQRWAMPPIIAEYSRFARSRGDQPHPPEPVIMHFLQSFKPELEVRRVLPARPSCTPRWLLLSLSMHLEDTPEGAAKGLAHGARQPSLHAATAGVEPGWRSPIDAIEDSAKPPSPQRATSPLVASSALSDTLQALAVEGLTMLIPDATGPAADVRNFCGPADARADDHATKRRDRTSE